VRVFDLEGCNVEAYVRGGAMGVAN
jgi:hypothetical protein